MKSGVRDLLILIVAVILAAVTASLVIKIFGFIIQIVMIIALAYVFFSVIKKVL